MLFFAHFSLFIFLSWANVTVVRLRKDPLLGCSLFLLLKNVNKLYLQQPCVSQILNSSVNQHNGEMLNSGLKQSEMLNSAKAGSLRDGSGNGN